MEMLEAITTLFQEYFKLIIHLNGKSLSPWESDVNIVFWSSFQFWLPSFISNFPILLCKMMKKEGELERGVRKQSCHLIPKKFGSAFNLVNKRISSLVNSFRFSNQKILKPFFDKTFPPNIIHLIENCLKCGNFMGFLELFTICFWFSWNVRNDFEVISPIQIVDGSFNVNETIGSVVNSTE